MDAQKYLKIAIIGVICVVVSVVTYGIYINDASRRHIEKMEAAQYTVLPVARTGYRDFHAFAEEINFTVRAPWTIDVSAQYEGVLSDVRVVKSQRVEEGEVLATMTNNDLLAQTASAEADIEAARAQFINAEQTANRYKQLVEHNAISMQEYDSAVAQRDAALAQMESRISKRDLMLSEQSKMTITAPRAANIIQVYREAGRYVRAGEGIFMLSDLHNLMGRSVMAHDKFQQLLSVGDRFILEIQPHRLTNKAYPFGETSLPKTTLKLNQFYMELVSVVPDANADTDFHEVVWRVENPTSVLEPTYYDSVRIMSMNTIRKLAIPSRAVQKDVKTGNHFVYTLSDESRLVRREITCGIEGDGLTEIVSGLSEGEPVVVADPSVYTEGMKVGAKEYEF
ncbi:MAG: efflux RND transporter periplasmic adaptor subunit [Schwartzia succinivorans]|nr:efflux RND transporter periplasmic adaptor subunit [Schwartzia succinivorans]